MYSLIPPLTAAELAQLEANLRAEGCRDPLVVWASQSVLVDGHNRYSICTRLGLPYQTVEREFQDRDAVKLWISENQLGRRNLSDDQRAAIGYRILQSRSAIAKRQRSEAANEKRWRDEKADASMSVTLSDKEPEPNSPPPKSDTRSAVAQEARVPERKLRSLTEVAKKAPELVQEIAAGKVTIKSRPQ